MLSAIYANKNQDGMNAFHLNTLSITQPQYPQSYGGGVLFPWRLHEMLEAAESKGFSSVVSWLPDQKSFKVHDKETFVSLIMGQYFEQTKFKSFQRQLNMWGFERLLSGLEKGGYTHEMFVRGKPSLCVRMNRLKKKSTAKANKKSPIQTSSVDDVPSMTALHSSASVVSHHDDEVTCSASSEAGEESFIGYSLLDKSYPSIEIEFDICLPGESSKYQLGNIVTDDPAPLNQGFEEFEGRYFFPVSDDAMSSVL